MCISLVMTAPVLPAGMVMMAPGLANTMKGVAEKVLYTAANTVSWRRPSWPLPRLKWIEAASVGVELEVQPRQCLVCGLANDGRNVWVWESASLLIMVVMLVVRVWLVLPENREK
jgi:hypothetical protein